MKKLTAKELEDLKSLRQEHYDLIYQIGEINIQVEEYQKLIQELQENKTLVLGKYAAILLKEKEMAAQLSKIYGEGQINMETGEIY